MRSLLLRRLAPLLVLLALVASACGSTEPRAASANGDDISVKSLQAELKVVKGNSKYRSALEQAYSAKLAGASKGTFNTSFAAQALTLRVYYDLIERDLAKRGIKVTASDDAKGRTTVKGQLDQLDKKVWTSFPADYRQQLAHQEAIVAKASDEAATGQIGKDYFAKHKAEFTTACVSHILITTDNKSDAVAKQRIDALKAQLDAGADFATLAKASSEDPGSKDKGGDLGCNPKGGFVKEFDDAVFSLPIGKVSDPVKTQYGYHLILVRSRGPAKLADVQQQLGQSAFNAYLLEVVCGAKTKVTIDPRYGTWDKKPCQGGQGLAKVAAPKQPSKSK
jgi:parvulin-like peptidyl-prolyl isomerase